VKKVHKDTMMPEKLEAEMGPNGTVNQGMPRRAATTQCYEEAGKASTQRLRGSEALLTPEFQSLTSSTVRGVFTDRKPFCCL
jgi:hypothetical protein